MFILLQTDYITETGYSYLKFLIQVYHRPKPHTKIVHFNIALTKTSYSLLWPIIWPILWNG